MTEQHSASSMIRPVKAAVSALALVIITVLLGGALGALTQAQFREIQTSWIEYSEGAEQKGILLSELRELLGYGGIIHNFKNYVLRQQPVYLDRTSSQLQDFDAVVSRFRGLTLSRDEQDALFVIEDTIGEYADKLGLAVQAAEEGWAPEVTDGRVKVDDEAAVTALLELERIWETLQQSSTQRLLAAVSQGQTLIWIGFLSIFALVLAACLVGWLLYMMFRDLRRAVSDLDAELKERTRLEASEERLATAVEQSPATIIITDTDARINYVNHKFTELTGWTLEDVQGRTPAFLQSGDTDPEVYAQIRNGLGKGEAWQGVFRNSKKDGSSYWAETTILPLLDPSGRIQNFIGIGEDITEKREAREQVVRAQKLEAVGQLAGGVAHDFNNVLTTIMGAAHLAALDAEEGSDLAGEIDQIEIATRRAHDLIRQLLTFARREPGQSKSVDLGSIAEEVIGLLKASVPPVISIALEPPSDRHFVLGDATHLHQIIMNLCRNAAEAMEGAPGRVIVSIAGSDAPASAPDNPEGWVKLTVRDDGPGMSADTQRRLFEPFFTTKPIGKSSGLGLSVVYGLVREMGGEINVTSELGHGTSITIVLPAAAPPLEDVSTQSEAIPRGSERVLLVDDDVEVLETFRRLLRRLGYRVDAFSVPSAALERFQAASDKYDIIVSDMVMPGMSGETLIQEIRKLNVDIPVIICSAFKPKRFEISGRRPVVLDKPVPPATLARALRDQLLEKANIG